MSAAAAAAAAAARRREELRLEEEQETAPMTADDGYEYKIIRSAWATFHRPAGLRAVLEQEAIAGWDLYEKLDNNRVRLRRPVTCREHDAELSQDPYRIWIGSSDSTLALWIILGFVFLIPFAIAIAALLN